MLDNWYEVPDEGYGRGVLDGDVVVYWRQGDPAGEILEMIGILGGDGEAVASILPTISGIWLHNYGRRHRHAQVDIVFSSGEHIACEDLFVSRDTRELFLVLEDSSVERGCCQ